MPHQQDKNGYYYERADHDSPEGKGCPDNAEQKDNQGNGVQTADERPCRLVLSHELTPSEPSPFPCDQIL